MVPANESLVVYLRLDGTNNELYDISYIAKTKFSLSFIHAQHLAHVDKCSTDSIYPYQLYKRNYIVQ